MKGRQRHCKQKDEPGGTAKTQMEVGDLRPSQGEAGWKSRPVSCAGRELTGSSGQ
jgi:hypothetical protein